MELLQSWDQGLFELLNQQWIHPFLDAVMPTITSSATYRLPALLVVAYMLIRGPAELRWTVLGLALTVGLTDYVSSSLLKPWIGRLRPSFVEETARMVIGPKPNGAFPSSHAANLTAALVYLYFRRVPTWIWVGLALVAPVVCYSRVYVGVHYPFDLVGGVILGAGIAGTVLSLPWRHLRRLPPPDTGKEAAGT